MHRLVDACSGDVLVASVASPRPLSRASARGLLGRDRLADGCGVLLRDPLRAVHTVGMRFPIDVVFIARDGRVACVVAAVGPGRVVWHRRGHRQLELGAGGAARAGLVPGRPVRLVRFDAPDGGRAAAESPQTAPGSGDAADKPAAARCGTAAAVLLIPLAAGGADGRPTTEGAPPCAPTC